MVSPGVGEWRVTREGRAEVEVTVTVGPRVLTGRLTRAELARAAGALDAAVEAERRGDYSRIRLGAALREAIGRDPLGSPGRDAREKLLPLALALLYVPLGIGFAVRHPGGWLQLLGWSVAAIALYDLARRGIRRARRRLR
ncbi:hypothetical protein [Actinoplanes nipponensis]|nr:hypothetical protein [Actinoplanes nipponensis]